MGAPAAGASEAAGNANAATEAAATSQAEPQEAKAATTAGAQSLATSDSTVGGSDGAKPATEAESKEVAATKARDATPEGAATKSGTAVVAGVVAPPPQGGAEAGSEGKGKEAEGGAGADGAVPDDDEAARKAFEARQREKALRAGPRPPHCVDALAGCTVSRKRSEMGYEKLRKHLDGCVLALYFGAWCPPCETFNPVLYALYYYLQNRQGAPKLEIVFCSSDTTKANYAEMTKRMPWCLLPFNDPAVAAMGKKYSVTGVPTVVLLDTDGSLICEDVSRCGAVRCVAQVPSSRMVVSTARPHATPLFCL